MSTTDDHRNKIVLIDVTSDSMLISWPEIPGAVRYVLEYRESTSSSSSSSSDFVQLSNKLTTTQARKKNLQRNEHAYEFRVRAKTGDANDDENTVGDVVVTHDSLFHLLTETQQQKRIQLAPQVSLGGSYESLRISWTKYDNVVDPSSTSDVSYEIQMRENRSGVDWTTLTTSLKGTEVKKKNLHSSNGYQFRVRPVIDNVVKEDRKDGLEMAFSPPSDPVVALGLSDGIKRLFASLENNTLLSKRKDTPSSPTPVPLQDALGGKEFILLYASAHWCGPCRQFTPQLTQWYNSLGGASSPVEVVFLSADHDENGFEQYYRTMPWLAIAFDDDTREQLMQHIRVTGIPRLAVLDGRTGRIIEDNAVGKVLDIRRWRSLVASETK